MLDLSNDNPFGRELLWWETDYEDQELWEEAHPIEWDELQEAYDQRRIHGVCDNWLPR